MTEELSYLGKQVVVLIGSAAVLAPEFAGLAGISLQAAPPAEDIYSAIFLLRSPQLTSLSELGVALRRHDAVACQSIVLVDGEQELPPQAAYFLKEVGIEIYFAGPNRHTQLKRFFSEQARLAEQVGSAIHYRREVLNCVRTKNATALPNLVKSLLAMQQYPMRFKVAAAAYRSFNETTLEKQALTHALRNDREALWAAHRLACLYLMQKRFVEGVEILEKLEKFHSMHLGRLLALGHIYLEAKLFDLAAAKFKVGNELTQGKVKHFVEGLAAAQNMQKGVSGNAKKAANPGT